MSKEVTYTRCWAMPSAWTFTIKPIKNLLDKYVGDGSGWVDPYAGKNSPAEITNDINPEMPTDYHLDAIEFCETLDGKYAGVLFDPPYSLRQIKECYNSLEIKLKYEDTLDASFGKVKDCVAEKIRIGGLAISFGWSSNGFGKNRGFEFVDGILVAHGGHHNDTIVTVERKINQQEKLFENEKR